MDSVAWANTHTHTFVEWRQVDRRRSITEAGLIVPFSCSPHSGFIACSSWARCVWVRVCLYALHTSPITHTHLLGLLSSWNISGIPTDESVLCPLLFFATSPFPVVKHIHGPPTTSPSGSAELRDDPSHQTSLGWFVGIRSLSSWDKISSLHLTAFVCLSTIYTQLRLNSTPAD